MAQIEFEPDTHRIADYTAEQLAVRAQGEGAEALAAFSELVERYNGRLYSFLLRRLAPADAEDLTQEAFIRAWQRIGTYDPRYRFSTWLFTIGTRLAISHGRSSRRMRPVALSDHPAQRLEPGAAASRAEERSRIWALVAEHLTSDQQTAVWLRYMEDMAIAEIARVMGRTQVGVRVMLFRARNTLAEVLERTEDGLGEVKPGTKNRLTGARCAGGAA